MVVKVLQREIKRNLMGKTRVRKALPTAGLFFLVCRCQTQKVKEVLSTHKVSNPLSCVCLLFNIQS